VRTRLPESEHVTPVDQAAARGGRALLRSHPELLGLLTLTWFFNLLYGPVEVALPLHMTDDLHAPGSLLGLYWALFGVGAVLGALAVGTLRRTVRRALGDPDAGQVATAAPGRHARGPQRRVLTASPLGTALGGPLTAALGPRATLGGSGLATVALGAVACVLLLARRRKVSA
jgi:hypothetical protein